MKKTTMALAILIAGAMLTTGSGNSVASRASDLETPEIKHGRPDKGKSVQMHGKFSGILRDDFDFRGQDVEMNEKTVIHSMLEGRVEEGAIVHKQHVMISGVVKDGILHAAMIIIQDKPMRVDPSDRGEKVKPGEGS
jgi:hypothetical protein